HYNFSYKIIISLLLAVMMLFSLVACTAPAANESSTSAGVETDKEVFTCAKAAELLSIHADGYSDTAPSKEDILSSSDPAAMLTHLDGVNMLYRAFKKLPKVDSGIRDLMKYRECEFTDVPMEGVEAVTNLTQAGLYLPKENTKFLPDEEMTKDELLVLIDRIHAYLQTNLKDDFYSYATAKILNDPNFFPYDVNTASVVTNDYNEELSTRWISSVFEEAEKNPNTKAKANIAAYLSTYTDKEGRANSMNFIKPYLDSIWNAKNFAALIDACADVSNDIGLEVLLTEKDFEMCSYCDLDDNGKLVLSFDQRGSEEKVDTSSYLEGGNFYARSMEQTAKLLNRLGFSKEESIRLTKEYCSFYYDKYELTNTGKYESGRKILMPNNLQEEISSFPLADYLKKAGYKNTEKISVTNYSSVATLFSLMQDEKYLDGVKCVVTAQLIVNMVDVVPSEIADAAVGMWDDYFAADESIYMQFDNTQFFLLPRIQMQMCDIYKDSDNYATLKTRVSTLFNNCILTYKDMLAGEDWLSEETRIAAIKKIEAMGIEILTPNDTSDMLRVEYKNKKNGGTLFENVTLYFRANRDWYISHVGEAYSKNILWQMTDMWSSNAFYSPILNNICMPIGYFICKQYDDTMTEEMELAQIGTMMAHEITHAFDSSGAMYGEDGSPSDWWTQSDKAVFSELCTSVDEYFNDYEYFPGYSKTGELVRDESIADMGAMKCALKIASGKSAFSYNEFFTEYAKMWAVSTTPIGCDTYLTYDEHGIGRARVNPLLSLFDEFYETYGITPGDAMYVAPENRPVVW
ncbi:MAG: M13-type metalloendopeptidase, partial [Angelakisella sp.]